MNLILNKNFSFFQNIEGKSWQMYVNNPEEKSSIVRAKTVFPPVRVIKKHSDAADRKRFLPSGEHNVKGMMLKKQFAGGTSEKPKESETKADAISYIPEMQDVINCDDDKSNPFKKTATNTGGNRAELFSENRSEKMVTDDARIGAQSPKKA